MKALITLAFLFSIGCADYEFGDGTRALFKFRQYYCDLAPGAVRDAAHEKAREMLGSYPEASWCDGIGFTVDVMKAI